MKVVENQPAPISPRVTVGLPVYNGAGYLERTARSVLDQTFGDLELVIADNASTDETRDICERLAAEDGRVRYCPAESNLGAAWNYNRLVDLARGDMFKWAPHDDPVAPTFLERTVALLDGDPDAVLAYTGVRRIDEAGSDLGLDRVSIATSMPSPTHRARHVISRVKLATPVTGLARLETLKKTRLIGSFPASDYVLLAELALLGNILEEPEPLMFRRIHDESSRKVNDTKKSVQAWFDPRAKSWPLLSIRQRLMLEYMRSAWRIRSGLGSRLYSAAELGRAYAWTRTRVVAGRIRRDLVHSEGR
ncbi:MAG: glycosyltransferase family 2 protein [Planctomycetota bacterium]